VGEVLTTAVVSRAAEEISAVAARRGTGDEEGP